jgi:hypothetical protein
MTGKPEDGHTFRFSAEARGSYALSTPERPEPHDHMDADWWGEPWTIEVRAWSLIEALHEVERLMTEHGLRAWTLPERET